MADVQRLRRLAERGDREAAAALHREATKSNDRALLRVATLGMGDPEAAGRTAAAWWTGDDTDALFDYARRWGVELTDAKLALLETLRVEINGNRRVRLLEPADLLAAIFEARHSPEPFVYRHGGLRKSGMDRPRTSVCMVVPAQRNGREVLVVGLTEASSTAHEPPRAWPDELRPWRKDLSKNLDRLASWADNLDTDRLLIDVCEATVQAADEVVAPDEPPELTRTQTLDALLAGEPSEAAFREVVSLLDKWPAKKGKEADAITCDQAVERATTAVADWPDAVCVVTRRTLGRLIKGKTRKPADVLYRHARLNSAPPAEISALADSAVAEQLTWLTLEADYGSFGQEAYAALASSPHLGHLNTLAVSCPIKDDELTTLLGATSMPALRTLDLSRGSGKLPAVAEPRLLASVERLVLRSLDENYTGVSVDAEAAAALFASPHVGGVRELMLGCTYRATGSDDIVSALGDSPHLGALRRLELFALTELGRTGMSALGQLPLEALDLHHVVVEAEAVAALFEGPIAETLRELAVATPFCTDTLAKAVAGARGLERVALSASSFPYHQRERQAPPPIGTAGARRLAGATWMPTVRSLRLSRTTIGDEGLAAILEVLEAGHLEMLVLTCCEIGAEGAAQLAGCEALTAVRTLILRGNPLGDEGFAALVASPHLVALERLGVEGCEIGTAGAAALATSEALPALRWLELRGNALGNDGALELSRSPALQRLERIGLYQSGIGKEGTEYLASSRWLEGRFDGLPGYAMKE